LTPPRVLVKCVLGSQAKPDLTVGSRHCQGVCPVSEAQHDARAGVVSAVGTIGAATLASRVLGYVRDMVVARALGASPVTGAFFGAFRVPNRLRPLLAEGALSTAVIPVCAEYLAAGGRTAFLAMVRAVAGATTLTLCAVTLAGVLLARPIVTVMAPGWLADP